MTRVIITDYTFPDLAIERSVLEPLGCTVVGGQWKTVEALVPEVADADYVIVQFAPFRAPVVAALRKARLIVRYGIGVDNVDLEAAKARSIPVVNVPDYCIDEVADHTLALLLSATRRLGPNARKVRRGEWGLATPLEGLTALAGAKVGVVGLGRIGREVVRRLLAFKCRVLSFDPVVPREEAARIGCIPVSLEDLLEQSDAVTLHCPSLPQTRQMIRRETIGRMKPGAILVNTSRGDLVETASLVEALQSGRLGAAALDVCDPEPVPADSPLRSLENATVTSHIASASVRAVRTLRESVARAVAADLRGEPLRNVVNGVKRA